MATTQQQEKPKLNTNTKPAGCPKPRFNQFSLDYERPILDDFVHGKFLTLKYTGKGQQFQVAGKEVVDFKQVGKTDDKGAVVKDDKGKELKVDKVNCSNEIKYITNIQGRNIEAKVDSSNNVRLWASLGEYDLGERLHFFAKLKTTKAFSNLSANFHTEYKGPRCNAHVRFDLKKDNSIFFNNKTIVTHNNLKAGYHFKLNLKEFRLRRYNAFVSYNHGDVTGYVEHVSQKKNMEKFGLGEIVAAALYKHKGHQVSFKASYDHTKNVKVDDKGDKPANAQAPKAPQPFTFTLASFIKVNNNFSLRAKADSTGEVCLSEKYKVNDNLAVLAGTRINLFKPAEFLTGRTIPIPLGLQVDFNF